VSRLSNGKIFTTIILVSLIIVCFSAGFASSVQADVNDRVSVIVGFRNLDGAKSASRYIGQITYSYQTINAVAASVPRSQMDSLKSNPNVAYVEQDGVAYALAQSVPWGVTKISAPTVWAGGDKGAGIKVAVLDTGIDTTHSDLKVIGGAAFVSGSISGATSYVDDNGHGTHCAGIIAALDNNIGVVGVAPEASLYAVKVLDRSGSGYISNIVSGIDWCIANGIQVISMSLGSSSDSTTLHAACDRAYNAGIVLVAAAGNSGPGAQTLLYPAKYSSVISVAATDSNDVVASWSSRGTGLSVSAPGVSVYSTYYGNRYATMSGTSMACPHVAGTVALILKNGAYTPTQVKATLQNTAVDLGVVGYDTTYGYGRIDAYTASGSPSSQPPAPVSNFSITAAPSSVNVNAGASNTSIVSATSINGFTGPVSLSAIAPQGWAVTFNPTALTLTSGATVPSTVTITAPSSATIGSYTITVSASNSTVTRSATITANVHTAPSAPQGLTATPGTSTVTLTWSAPASNGGTAVIGYKVYRGTTSGGETTLTTLGNVLSYIDSVVTNGQPYYYRVTALNAVGESANSNEASATPTATPAKALAVSVSTNRPSYNSGGLSGSSVYVTVTVKDANTLKALRDVYVSLTISNPDNSVAYNTLAATNKQGIVQFIYQLGSGVQTGTYTVNVSVSTYSGYPPATGQTTFNVF
jgi:minor extracellular protease Epr